MSTTYSEPDGSKTAGWSGSEASHERAVEERDSGVLSVRMGEVLEEVAARRAYGATVAELRGYFNLHHGQISSALTNLHRAGRLARLAEKRGRCHIYVHPEYVGARVVQLPGRTKANTPPALTKEEQNLLQNVNDHILNGWAVGNIRTRRLVEIIERLTGETRG